MSATVCIVIDDTNSSITQLNQLLDTYMGAPYKFTVANANATAGAVYTNNSQNFTVVKTIVSGTDLVLIATSTGSPASPTGTLTLSTGTGDSTIADTAFKGTADVSNQLNACIDYLARCSMGGVAASTVQVTVRDTDPSVAASGSGSTQVTFNIG